jgi:hypothetical protein
VETSDVAAELARAKAANLPLIDQMPRQGLAGTIAFLHPGATHGVLVELAQPAEPDAPHPTPPNRLGAVGIGAFYVGARDPGAMAEAFARNFDGTHPGLSRDPAFPAETITVELGKSRVTIFDSAGLAASAEASGFLGGKVEGLFGLCLSVRDFPAAQRYLAEQNVPLEVRERTYAIPLARVASDRTRGVGLFISSSP